MKKTFIILRSEREILNLKFLIPILFQEKGQENNQMLEQRMA